MVTGLVRELLSTTVWVRRIRVGVQPQSIFTLWKSHENHRGKTASPRHKNLLQGSIGVIVSARVGRKPTPIIAYIQFQFGDRDTFDISETVWVEEKRAWVVE